MEVLASDDVHHYSRSIPITPPSQMRGVNRYDTQQTPCMQPTPMEGTRVPSLLADADQSNEQAMSQNCGRGDGET